MGASKTEGPKAPKFCKLGLEKKSFHMDNLIGQICHELQTHSLQV